MIWCVCADEQSSVNQPWPKGFYQLNSLTSNKRLMLSLVWFGPWCLFIRCSLFTEVQSEQFCSFPASHAVTSRYLLLGLGCEEPVVHILACEKHWVVSLWLDLLLAAKRSCIQQFMQSSQKLIMQNYQKRKHKKTYNDRQINLSVSPTCMQGDGIWIVTVLPIELSFSFSSDKH